jgi:antitoxin component of MazEF toxin-antitoxin module
VKWKAVRQLSKNGNCLTVALPRQAIAGLNLMRSDYLEVIYDDVERTVTVSPLTHREVGVTVEGRTRHMMQVEG